MFHRRSQREISSYYQHKKLLTFAVICSSSVAIFLVVLKLFVWWFSDSVSVLASSIDSMMDLLASLISLFAVRVSLIPADENHHFGHSKAENIAALAQSSFIAGSAIYLIVYALRNLSRDTPLRHSEWAIYAIIVSTVITCFLVAFQTYVVYKTKSVAIKADTAHYCMDIFLNIGVLAALIFSHYGWYKADIIISLVIACIMLLSVKKIAIEAIDLLMDKALPEKELQQIKKTILEHASIKGVTNLRTRQSIDRPFIQFYLQVDGALSLKEAHAIGIQVKENLLKKSPNADIIFYMAPVL